ncbi:MAG: holo-ACP synthase [Candidatus Binatia bacterium]
MMQYYQGIDLVERNKFRRIFRQHAGLLEEIFTTAEQRDCLTRKDSWKHFAGRFAAKEACLKALQLGLYGLGIDHVWGEIEILAQGSGRWKLVTHDWIARLGRKKGISRGEISISYTRNYAVAAALLVVDPASQDIPRASQKGRGP